MQASPEIETLVSFEDSYFKREGSLTLSIDGRISRITHPNEDANKIRRKVKTVRTQAARLLMHRSDALDPSIGSKVCKKSV